MSCTRGVLVVCGQTESLITLAGFDHTFGDNGLCGRKGDWSGTGQTVACGPFNYLYVVVMLSISDAEPDSR